MENELILDRAKETITNNINAFLKVIEHECDVNNPRQFYTRGSFPCFNTMSDEFYICQRYNEFLEINVRDYLVSNIIFELLSLHNIDHITYRELYANNKILSYNFDTNEIFEKKYSFSFILPSAEGNSGFRYFDIPYDRKEFKKQIRKEKIKFIYIIDWENLDSDTPLMQYEIFSEKEKYEYITIKSFMQSHFSTEIFNYYKEQTLQATEQARKIIGYDTLSILSPRHLSEFKSTILQQITPIKINNLQYKYYKCKKPFSLDSEDRATINSAFFKNELYLSIVGSKEFAQCFFTSEYLYSVMPHQENFDYTSIACGYLKAVEELLYLIYQSRYKDEMYLWTICYKREKCPQSSCEYYLKCRQEKNSNKKQYRRSIKSEDKPDMGKLIYHLKSEESYWNISDNGIDAVCSCLDDFRRYCRNDHFHKDNITDHSIVSTIRNNSLFCLYLLLGATNICDDISEKKSVLGIIDFSYDSLYNTFANTWPKMRYFLIEFPNKTSIKTLFHFEQSDTEYDKDGKVTTKLKFVKVDNFVRINDLEAFMSSLQENDYIYLSNENMPTRVWYISRITNDKTLFWGRQEHK